jgi:hypothetical protein
MPTTALEVKRVPLSEELLHSGEYVLIQKREPQRSFVSVPFPPPSGCFRFLRWKFIGPKFELKTIEQPVWPDADTIVVNCPLCKGPVATTKHHTIAAFLLELYETRTTRPANLAVLLS